MPVAGPGLRRLPVPLPVTARRRLCPSRSGSETCQSLLPVSRRLLPHARALVARLGPESGGAAVLHCCISVPPPVPRLPEPPAGPPCPSRPARRDLTRDLRRGPCGRPGARSRQSSLRASRPPRPWPNQARGSCWPSDWAVRLRRPALAGLRLRVPVPGDSCAARAVPTDMPVFVATEPPAPSAATRLSCTTRSLGVWHHDLCAAASLSATSCLSAITEPCPSGSGPGGPGLPAGTRLVTYAEARAGSQGPQGSHGPNSR